MGFSLGGAIQGGIAGFASGGWWGAAAGALGGGLMGGEAADGVSETNKLNSAEAQRQRDFNAAEAEKSRNWQEYMRSNQYQTAITDMKAAGLNPMLAYSQGGAGTPNGATASAASLPQISNKTQAALNASAQAAQVANTLALTKKTDAETNVAEAQAENIRASTVLTTNSATNMEQTIERTKAEIDKTKQEVYLVRQQTSESTQRQVLIAYQTDLIKIEQDLAKGKITLQEAQTQLTRIQTRLAQYDIAGARAKSDSDETWYGRNIRPYLNDAVKGANSAGSLYQLRR